MSPVAPEHKKKGGTLWDDDTQRAGLTEFITHAPHPTIHLRPFGHTDFCNSNACFSG